MISETARKTDYFDTQHLRTGLRTRALRGASLTIIGQIFSFSIETIGVILLSRLLTPDDFGLVTMVLAFSMLLQNLGCNGFIEAVVQKEEINHKQVSTLFWINAALSLILALLFIASAPLIAWFYNEPRLKVIVVALSATILLGGLSNQHVSLLVRNMQFYKTTGNEIAAKFVSIIVALVMAWRGLGYWAVVAKWVMFPLMITVGAWIVCGWRPGYPARGTGVRPLLKFAFNTYGNFVMSYIRRNIDKMLIGRSYGSLQLGSYDRAYHLSNMLPIQIMNPLNNVSIATFSRLSDDHEKYRLNYLNVLAILAFIGMPISAALTLISSDLILLLLGPKWSAAGKIFCAFGPSIGVAIIYLTHGWLHLSLGTPDKWFRWSIVEFTVTILCIAVGLLYGTLGVAVAFSASFYILIGPALWYAGKPIELRLSLIWSRLWKYYVSALAAGILCWIIIDAYDMTSRIYRELPILIRMIVTSGLCFSLYLLLLTVLHKSIQPIMQVIIVMREMIPKKSPIS